MAGPGRRSKWPCRCVQAVRAHLPAAHDNWLLSDPVLPAPQERTVHTWNLVGVKLEGSGYLSV